MPPSNQKVALDVGLLRRLELAPVRGQCMPLLRAVAVAVVVGAAAYAEVVLFSLLACAQCTPYVLFNFVRYCATALSVLAQVLVASEPTGGSSWCC